MANKATYNPDYVSCPGGTLQQTLEAIGMSQQDLALRTGRTQKNINEIIKGKAPITPEFSIQLERVLGAPARFWDQREKNYQEFLAKKHNEEKLKLCLDWVKNFPTKEMMKLRWIDIHDNKDSMGLL